MNEDSDFDLPAPRPAPSNRRSEMDFPTPRVVAPPPPTSPPPTTMPPPPPKSTPPPSRGAAKPSTPQPLLLAIHREDSESHRAAPSPVEDWRRDEPSPRQASQRWRDPSATIFRDLSLGRAGRKDGAVEVLDKQHSRSNQELVSPNLSVTPERRSGVGLSERHFRSGAASRCAECFRRIPYGSLLATVITGAGVACACVCMHLGLPSFIAMLRLFKITIREGVEGAVMTAVISIGAVMSTLAIVLLIIGFLATGATQRQVYTGFRSRISGRIASAFFIVLTYVLTMLWFLFCLVLILVLCLFFIGIGNCDHYGADEVWRPQTCFNVTVVLDGIPGDTDLTQVASRLCGSEFARFCEEARGSFVYFCLATGGAAAIVLGLVHFLTCLSANYAHIKDGMKLREYEEAKYAIDPAMYADY